MIKADIPHGQCATLRLLSMHFNFCEHVMSCLVYTVQALPFYAMLTFQMGTGVPSINIAIFLK